MSITKSNETLTYKRDAEGHYICEKCGYRTPSTHQSTMHYHMKKHTKDFPYECLICKCGFAQKQTLLNHMKARHPEQLKEKENMFKCPFKDCAFQSITKGNCLIHVARRHFSHAVENHLETTTVGIKKTHHCICCTKDFKSPSAFYYHILKCLMTFDLIESKEVETLV